MFLDAFSPSESESEVHLSPKNLIPPLATLPCLAVTHCTRTTSLTARGPGRPDGSSAGCLVCVPELAMPVIPGDFQSCSRHSIDASHSNNYNLDILPPSTNQATSRVVPHRDTLAMPAVLLPSNLCPLPACSCSVANVATYNINSILFSTL